MSQATAASRGGAPGAAAPAAFSTVGLPAERRVELWESYNADALIGLRCRTLTTDVLDATVIDLQLDRVRLARVQGSSHVVERDATMVRRRPTESVALFFSLAGEAFFYHDDGVRTVQPGQLLVCDADQPFMRGFSQGLEELVLKIPREVFAEVTGIDSLPRPVVSGFAAGSNVFAHALAQGIGGAARGHDPRAVDEHTLLELVAAVTAGDGRDLSAAHHAAARAYVERHLTDPGLSAVRVATAIGISTRHLSRVFGEAGTTFPQHVLSRRLEVARRMLEAPDAAAMAVAEVASRCGFVSAAHFSGAFRAHYGERPSDVRRRASVARLVQPG